MVYKEGQVALVDNPSQKLQALVRAVRVKWLGDSCLAFKDVFRSEKEWQPFRASSKEARISLDSSRMHETAGGLIKTGQLAQLF